MLRLIVKTNATAFTTYDFSCPALKKDIGRGGVRKLIGLEILKEVAMPLPAGSAPRLIDCGERKIAVIRAIREHTGFGLAEAKDVADSAPCDLPTTVRDMAELIHDLQAAGATVALPIQSDTP